MMAVAGLAWSTSAEPYGAGTIWTRYLMEQVWTRYLMDSRVMEPGAFWTVAVCACVHDINIRLRISTKPYQDFAILTTPTPTPTSTPRPPVATTPPSPRLPRLRRPPRLRLRPRHRPKIKPYKILFWALPAGETTTMSRLTTRPPTYLTTSPRAHQTLQRRAH